MTIFLTEADIEHLLTYDAAVPVIEHAFRLSGEGGADNPTKIRIPTQRGFLQFGPGVISALGVMGYKVWANAGTPFRGVAIHLYDCETGAMLAVMQAYLLTKLRTAAVTSVAAKALSPDKPVAIGMYGAGKQADAQLAALQAVRPLSRVEVYSRTPDRLREFCARATVRFGIDVIPATPEQTARDKDIIVTVTSASQPILLHDWITRPGLIIGQGANHWHERELDARLVAACKLVVVDSKSQAMQDGGDLLFPISKGMLTWHDVAELGDVLAGKVPVPGFGDGLVLFKSHGIGLEDVAIAKAAYDLARQRGIGQQLPDM